VNLVLAQRLARKVCVDCKQPLRADKSHLEEVGLTPEQIAGAKLMKGPVVGRATAADTKAASPSTRSCAFRTT